jgi:hypothetical protein
MDSKNSEKFERGPCKLERARRAPHEEENFWMKGF